MWTRIIILTLFLLKLTASGYKANKTIELKINAISKFPHLIDEPFDIRMGPSNPALNILSDFSMDTLLVRITDKTNSEIERIICVYGDKNETCAPFSGDFFQIPSWVINHKKKYISLYILFTKHVNQMILQIYQITAQSKEMQAMMTDDLKFSRKILESKITLEFPSKILLRITSLSEKSRELYANETGLIRCRSYGSTSAMKPVITNKNQFIVKSEKFNEDKNELTMNIYISPIDHMEKVYCSAGDVETSATINVSHRPSKVTIIPNANGSDYTSTAVECRQGNGYPIPTSYWTFVQGPRNASLYYRISETKNQLYFLDNIPNDSVWLFNCSASNVFKKSSVTFNRTMAFKIKGTRFHISDFNDGSLSIPDWKVYTDSQLIKMNAIKENLDSRLNALRKDLEQNALNLKELEAKYSRENIQRNLTSEKIFKQIQVMKGRIDNINKQLEEFGTNNKVVKNKDDMTTMERVNLDLKEQKKAIDLLNQSIKEVRQDLMSTKATVQTLSSNNKLFLLAKLSIMSQLNFVKENLYWISPIRWTITQIDTIEDPKKEGISHPFYSAVKNYKMYLLGTFTKDTITFLIYLPSVPRNDANGWPFNCIIRITIENPLLPLMSQKKIIKSKIYKITGQSDPVVFDRHELQSTGHNVEKSITVACDVTEV